MEQNNDDELRAISLRHVWSTLKVNRYIIGSFILATASLSMLYSFFAIPDYNALVTVTVTTDKPVQMMNDIVESSFREDDVTNKINKLPELFHSPDVAEQVLQDVIHKGYGPVPLFAGSGFSNFLASLGLVKRQPLEEALRKGDREHVAAQLMSYLTISPDVNDTSVIIKSSTPNPQFSAFLADTAAQALLDVNHRMSLTRITEVKQFLGRQETEMGDQLKALESKLADYQSAHDMISVDEAERSVDQRLDQETQSIIETRVLLKTNVKLMADIERSMTAIRNNISNPNFNGSNLYLTQMQHRLTLLQYQIDVLQQDPAQKEGEQAQALKKEMAEVSLSYKNALDARHGLHDMAAMSPLEYYQYLEQSLASLKRDNRKLTTNIEVLSKSVEQYKAQFPKLADSLLHLNELKRNIQLTSDLYLTLKKKLQETEIEEAGSISDLVILAHASVPGQPRTASIALKFLFSLGVGGFLGLVFVLAREALSPRVRSRFDLEKRGLTVLGEVPLTEEKHWDRPVIVVNELPTSFEADVLRAIRLRLTSIAKKTGAGEGEGASRATVVHVTSPRKGNGKTFVAANLAMVLAKAQYRVLLIDLDLRKPSIHNYFKGNNKAGVGDLVPTGQIVAFDSVVTAIDPFLDVIFSGKRVINPAEFLASKVVPEMMDSQRANYDFIIVDSPPIMGVIDPVITAAYCDVVLMVVEHRKTLREDVTYSTDALHEVYSKPILSLMNGVHREFSHFGAYEYDDADTNADAAS